MYKGSDFQNKPIIAINTGKVVERVKDVLFDAQNNKLVGLQVNSGAFASKLAVPFSSIKAIGPDAITVADENVVVKAEFHPELQHIVNQGYSVNGTKIITEAGKHLGKISDVMFDEKSGEVKGYEISSGAFSDMYTGKSFMPAASALKLGKDVVIVPNEIEGQLNEQVGGIKASMQQAGQKTGKYASSMRDRTRESNVQDRFRASTEEMSTNVQQGWEKVKAKFFDLKDRNQSRVQEQRIKDALGKPVTRVILDEQDNVVLKTGDLITHEAIGRAYAAGAIDMLLSSVYTETPTFTSEELKTMGREFKHS